MLSASVNSQFTALVPVSSAASSWPSKHQQDNLYVWWPWNTELQSQIVVHIPFCCKHKYTCIMGCCASVPFLSVFKTSSTLFMDWFIIIFFSIHFSVNQVPILKDLVVAANYSNLQFIFLQLFKLKIIKKISLDSHSFGEFINDWVSMFLTTKATTLFVTKFLTIIFV